MPSGSEPRAPARPFEPADLRKLDPEDFRTLAYASAIGVEFDFELLADAMGAESEPLAERTERLVERGLLRERPGGGRFGFVAEELRALVYQSMTESRLRVLHRKIAQSLERHHPHPDPEVVTELGRHYFLGKVPEKAWRFNRDAAREARAAHRPEAAIHELERARRDLGQLPGEHAADLAEIDEQLGDLHRARGRPDAAEESYLAALSALPSSDRASRARLLLARADIARSGARQLAAEGLGDEALAIARSIGDRRGEGAAHRIRGRMAFERGDFRAALDEAMIALDLFQQVGDREGLADCSTDIAQTFAVLGPEVRDDALRWFRRAVEILSATENRYELARAYINLAATVGLTDPAAGLEYYVQAEEIGEAIASPQTVVWTLLRRIDLLLALGRIDDAEGAHDQAARLLERIVEPRAVPFATIVHGTIAERRGDWERAEGDYRAGIARAEQLGLVADAAEGELRLARLLLKMHDLVRARDTFLRVLQHDLARLRPALGPSVEELRKELGPGERRPAETPGAAHPREYKPPDGS